MRTVTVDNDTECPTCGKYFERIYLQHQHARETGHEEVEYCENPHLRTKRKCRRDKFHPGVCEYVGNGGYGLVQYDSPIQRVLKPIEKKALKLPLDKALALVRLSAIKLGMELGYDLSDGWIVDCAEERFREYAEQEKRFREMQA